MLNCSENEVEGYVGSESILANTVRQLLAILGETFDLLEF